MMNMSMSDDNDRQLRIRGIFADIQFLASHTPDAQVLVSKIFLPSQRHMLCSVQAIQRCRIC